MAARTYTFETPTDVIAMDSLIATFTKTTSLAKKNAIRKVFDSMACEHGYITSIKGTDTIYHWDRMNYIGCIWTHTHDCQPVQEIESPVQQQEEEEEIATKAQEESTVITQEIEINHITYTVAGRDEQELAQETAKLEQEITAQWQEVNQMQEETPLQGVASFLQALAVFSSHDIFPLDITDFTLYEQLKAKWDAMNGDALCECKWCDAEPLQTQEELQFMEKQNGKPEIQESSFLSADPNGAKVTVWNDGEIWIESAGRTSYLLAHEAYNLMEALYQNRDTIRQHAYQDEEEPIQEQHTDTPVLYAVDYSGFPRDMPVHYLTPDETTVHVFHSHAVNTAIEEFMTVYPHAKRVSKETLHEESNKRTETYWQNKGPDPRYLLGTGLLSWPREERITGRYGLVALFDEDWDALKWEIDISPLVGKYGALVAVLDGEEIELGKGECFSENHYDIDHIGLRPPLDYLEEEWLSPSQLRKVDGHIINKPVKLWFVDMS